MISVRTQRELALLVLEWRGSAVRSKALLAHIIWAARRAMAESLSGGHAPDAVEVEVQRMFEEREGAEG